MSIILSAYVPRAFCQFLLPSVNNTDYQIALKKKVYHLSQDFVLKLEVVNNKWFIKATEEYTLEKTQGKETQYLSDGDIWSVRTQDGKKISILVWETTECFREIKKYDISESKSICIGCDEKNQIIYQYRSLVSGKHAEIIKRERGYELIDCSTNGTFVNGERIEGSYSLVYGDSINIFGLKIIYMEDIIAIASFGDSYEKEGQYKTQGLKAYTFEKEEICVKNTYTPTEKHFFHRSPRNYMAIEADVVEIDPPPSPKEPDKRPLWMVIGPSFTMVIPMLLSSLLMIYGTRTSGNDPSLFMFTGIVTAIGSAVVGIFWALNNIRYNKKSIKEAEKHRFEAYGEYLIQKVEEIRKKYEDCRNKLHIMYPAADVVSTYGETSPELWNRNVMHEDFLSQRIGLGKMQFPTSIHVPKEKFMMVSDDLIQKPQQIQKDYSILYNVPMNVDLLNKKLIGIVGGEDKKGAFDIVRLLSAQIAANNCYTDVKLVYVYNQDIETENWEYTKWFPHVWSEDKKKRYVATNKTEASDIFFELMQIFRFRSDEGKSSKREIQKPYYILFVSDVSLLEGELITKYIYDSNNSYGVTSFILTESREQLPNECDFVIQKDTFYQGVHDLSQNSSEEIIFDEISAKQIIDFARRLLPIEVKEVEVGRDIPESISFFEMHNVNRLDDFNVKERWLKNRNYENMKALIGLKGGGVPCYLDVHEKYHGPHGLVAGTTGSGKSETLQTYLLSLAINFSPDDIGFFIIDYKGGGMAGLFDKLPHMMGSISNLSGNQVRRAMVSIKSENKRRQRLFNENNVNNINLYTKLYKSGTVAEPIPHLFIIIDEFAELKREEPEFMKELISVAQVGRSLGVHLILATQKPSGTVDDNIWSNAKFRLCLRVQDQQDSKDMLRKPDAAFITQAGRGYLQVGNDEIYELFQSGYSGAAYVENHTDMKNDIAVMVSTTGQDAYVGAGKRVYVESGKTITQLDAVIEYLGTVAKQEGYAKQAQLWMPLLPENMYLSDIDGCETEGFDGEKWPDVKREFRLSSPIGLCDDPVNQAQMPFEINFAESGHLAVCGTIVSGKSTFLQSLLYSLICKYSPKQLNVYVMDFSAQILGCFEQAPHVGGVMLEEDTEKIAKFFHMMEGIIEQRKKMFRGGNFAQYIRVNGYEVPAILIVIDNYGSFREKNQMKYDDRMMRIAKEGVGYGIFLVLSAAGFATAEIPSKMGNNIKNVVCLNMNDKYAYMDALRVNRLEVFPENNVKGRGLCVYNEVPLEFQTALALPADDDFARGEKLRAICAQMKEAWKGSCARKIPVIPEKPIYTEYESLEEVKQLNSDGRYVPIGYDMVSADIYGIDLFKTYSYLVSGRAQTGKTNLLKALIRMTAAKNANVVVIEHGTSELAVTAERAKVIYINTVEQQAQFFAQMITPFKERNAFKKELIQKEKDESEIFEEMQVHKPYFIIVSDMVAFIKSVYIREAGVPDISPFVENIAEKGKLHNIYFFFGINPDTTSDVAVKKAYVGFTSYRTGIHLGGNISSTKFFDSTNFDFKEQSRIQKPGVGMLPMRNNENVKFVVLPFVKG